MPSINLRPSLNSLLAALPPIEYERLVPDLQLLSLDLGETLSEPGCPMDYVYFPINSILCFVHTDNGGRAEKAAVIGHDGASGSQALSGESTFARILVLQAGHTYRIHADTLNRNFKTDSFLQLILLRYTQVIISQLMLTGKCHRQHTTRQQLCRWLLCSLDLFKTSQLKTSVELISDVLGLATGVVTEAVDHLQEQGLLIVHKSHFEILDRSALQQCTCSCYRDIKLETEKWLPHDFDRRKTPRPGKKFSSK
jgi:CRP-like cAMP-binding protein